MALQNVGTPRFYVDTISWLKAIGIGTARGEESNPTDYGSTESVYDIWGSDASNPYIASTGLAPGTGGGDRYFKYNYNWVDGVAWRPHLSYNFVAYLGHKLADFNGAMEDFGFYKHYDDTYTYHPEIIDAVNFVATTDSYGGFGLPTHDGFSIVMIDPSPSGDVEYGSGVGIWMHNRTGIEYQIGKVIAGNYFDMPHSPDLNLKLSYEMDGVKTIQTKGGATLSNASYTKPADWGDRGAWQLSNSQSEGWLDNLKGYNYRNGRRVWDLSFSYLSDSDVFPENAGNTLSQWSEEGDFETNILDGTDFFSQVWNRTMGGHLPFIFQPDKDNSNADQFALCRFDMNSLQYDQVANNVYNVKLKIRESW